MTLRKLFILTLGIMLAMFLVVPASHAAMALKWDTYTDSSATGLRIETSDSETGTWTQLGADLPTSATAVAITGVGFDDSRVYYRVVAFNTAGDAAESGVVNYYWGPGGGGGGIGLQPPGGVGFVDCTPENLGAAELAVCQAAGLK